MRKFDAPAAIAKLTRVANKVAREVGVDVRRVFADKRGFIIAEFRHRTAHWYACVAIDRDAFIASGAACDELLYYEAQHAARECAKGPTA